MYLNKRYCLIAMFGLESKFFQKSQKKMTKRHYGDFLNFSALAIFLSLFGFLKGFDYKPNTAIW